MAKKTARQILCILIFFLSLPAVFAKSSKEVSYFEVLIQKLNDVTSVYEDYYSLSAKGDVKKVDIAADLEVGKYRYQIEDSEWYYFEISDESRKSGHPVDVNFSVGYVCPVILFDDVIPDYMGERYWPLSGTANFEILPIKTRAGNFGFAIKGYYSRMEKDHSTYKISGNLVSAYLDLVWQIPLNRVFAFDFHAGAGGLFFNNFEVNYNTVGSPKKMNSLDLSFDGGLALNVFFTRHFFLRTGADFTYSIMTDMILGDVIPEMSLGLHF